MVDGANGCWYCCWLVSCAAEAAADGSAMHSLHASVMHGGCKEMQRFGSHRLEPPKILGQILSAPLFRRCLEAISQSVHVSARPWTGMTVPQQQYGGRPELPPLSTAAMMASMPSVSLDALLAAGEGGHNGCAQPGSPRKRGRRQAGFASAQPNGDQHRSCPCRCFLMPVPDVKRQGLLVSYVSSS